MKANRLLVTLVLLAAGLLAGCFSDAQVGALQTESQSVELGDATAVRVQINFAAGNLKVTGGAEKLLDAEFNYNVAKLKPEVKYSNGTLVLRQPEANGLPLWGGIEDYRNDWVLRLSDKVPMDLTVNASAGYSDLQLAGLSLTKLNIILGAGTYTLDLSGKWARNLPVSIDAGAANITVRLPRDVGARVNVNGGPNKIRTTGVTREGNAYTNAAYGSAPVSVQVEMKVGVGQISLNEE